MQTKWSGSMSIVMRNPELLKTILSFCPYNIFTACTCKTFNNVLKTKKGLRTSFTDVATAISCVDYAIHYGCKERYYVMRAAVIYGNVDVMQWLCTQHKFALSECFTSIAACHGRLAILMWLRRQGCPWHAIVCSSAAFNGHLDILQWARKHGCPWGEDTCTSAADGGHLDILKWAREHGCLWNERTCIAAAYGGHLEVLQWARQHGCPWEEETCTSAAYCGHLEVLQWAREHGCPE